MKYMEIQVIVNSKNEQVSPAVATVIKDIIRSIQGYSSLDAKLALGLAEQMSKFFHSQSFGEMVEEIENPVIDEMDASHSKNEEDYSDEASR